MSTISLETEVCGGIPKVIIAGPTTPRRLILPAPPITSGNSRCYL